MSAALAYKPSPEAMFDVWQKQLSTEIARRTAEVAEKDLFVFFRDIAWPALMPNTPFADNWHVHAICEHLQAVTDGEIQFLIINMPFRLLKSTIVSQAWPAWEWVRRPSLQYLTASYAKDVATRDAVNSRRIIESDQYQACFAKRFVMTSDQNVKTRYENNRRGMRVVTSTDAAGTGFGGNRVIIDDPISSLDANNEAARLSSIEWYKGTAATRLNNPKEDCMVLVHQRLHEQDLTGYILAEEGGQGWEQLVLPMRYSKKHFCTTKIGFKDPRTKEGELLHPERLPEDTVRTMESKLGAYHTSAQLQQRPTARGGVVFDSSWFVRYKVLPRIIRRIIYGDTAQKTKEHNDYSVFELWGKGDDGKIYLLDLIRGKWPAHELNKQAVAFWDKHQTYDELVGAPLWGLKIEDKTSGTGLIQYIANKGGIPVFAIPRTKDKLTRAYDGQPYIEKGLVCIPSRAPWVSDYTTEFDRFTKDDTHDHDDQIDPTLDAINDMLATNSLYDNL